MGSLFLAPSSSSSLIIISWRIFPSCRSLLSRHSRDRECMSVIGWRASAQNLSRCQKTWWFCCIALHDSSHSFLGKFWFQNYLEEQKSVVLRLNSREHGKTFKIFFGGKLRCEMYMRWLYFKYFKHVLGKFS